MLFTIYFIYNLFYIYKFLLHFVIFFSVINHLLMENCKLAVKLLFFQNNEKLYMDINN